MAQTAEILEALPPAQEQPAGLALLDLNVTATPLVITWDKDAVSTLLDTVLAQYAGLEVQEADVPAIKNEMAGLNRLKERMDNARKDIKADCRAAGRVRRRGQGADRPHRGCPRCAGHAGQGLRAARP